MHAKFRIGTALIAAVLHAPLALATSPELASTIVQTAGAADSASFDGVIEAVRQTVIAAQVQGAIVELNVKAGDTVKQGQVLARIDARAAAQNSAASRAQVLAARASLDVATREYQRQQQLFKKQYISQAAFERAEAQFRATSAQLEAQIAQASASDIQSGFFIIRAPYAGVVADVPAVLGDMALPGKPLLTLYDPAALRVTAPVPQSAVSGTASGQPVKVELPGLPAERRWLSAPRLQVLPTIDAGTHSAQVRILLPDDVRDIAPGSFARVWLPASNTASQRLYVPVGAIVRRAEMTGVYVIGANGKPVLRQVRMGRTQGGLVEVLSGVTSGERVALDPQSAARVR